MTKEQLGKMILSSERQMYAIAKKILQNEEDCADAIQEAIVKAFSKRDSLNNDRFAKTWFIRILMNECYNLKRKEARTEFCDEAYLDSIASTVETKDFEELHAAMDQLKDDLKIPVVLYYFEDFSIGEISKVMGITEGAVQKRLARARQKLKNTIHLEEVLS